MIDDDASVMSRNGYVVHLNIAILCPAYLYGVTILEFDDIETLFFILIRMVDL